MAGVSPFNSFTCKSISLTSKPQSVGSKISLSPINSIGISSKNINNHNQWSRISSNTGLNSKRPIFRTQAIDDGEIEDWSSDKIERGVSEGGEVGTTGTAVAEPPKEPTEIDLLKKALVDSLYGTDRGLKASSETRAEIIELITQLEAKNPTPAPNEALTLLNGKWILAYTSFVGLFPLMTKGALPLVSVEEISQTIDAETFTVQNSVQFAGPLATTSLSTNAKFEVRSPQRVQIKFDQGIIGTPQLTDSLVFPEDVEFLGQKIDLSPFKGLITSLQDTASSVAKSISDQPPFKFPITSDSAQSWLLTTYLDEELRISRGDGGSVFVLIKEGSYLLKP